MLTSSLGWVPSPARFAMTSLALVLVEVPEPVWNTSIGNCRSCLPAAISAAAFSIRPARRLGSKPSSALTADDAPLIRASHCTTAGGTRSPEMGKFTIAFAVSPPHSCLPSVIHLSFSSAARTMTLPAERRQLTREPHRVVVGHQKARALQHPQLPLRQQREGLFGPGERVQRVSVGPQQQHRHLQAPVQLEQVR